MNSNFIKLVIIIGVFFFTGCEYFDFWNFFESSPVDERFRQKDSLKGFASPSIADDGNFNFMAIADTHYYQKQPDIIKTMNADNASLNLSYFVVIGDIVQAGIRGQFDLALADFSTTSLPIYPLIGNHDLYNDGFEIYKNVFGRTVYDLKIGNKIHMVFLDTANGTLGDLQKTWLENILKASSSEYKIVFTHYSPIDDSELQTFTTYSYPDEAYFLYDLFDKYDVDYCVAGHLHSYAEKEIRGVRYIIINNFQGKPDNHLLFSVKNGILGYRIY